jgi:hypothetical protein
MILYPATTSQKYYITWTSSKLKTFVSKNIIKKLNDILLHGRNYMQVIYLIRTSISHMYM